MQEQSMAGQNTTEPMSIEESTVHAILERRDMELAHKQQQCKSFTAQLEEEQSRFERLISDRDRVSEAFAVAINACDVRIAALRQALSRHDDADDVSKPQPDPEYARSLDERAAKAARTDNAASRY